MVDTASVAESEFIKLDTEKESDSEMESEDGEPEVPKKKVPNVVSGSRTAMLEQVPIQTSFYYLSGTLVFGMCLIIQCSIIQALTCHCLSLSEI